MYRHFVYLCMIYSLHIQFHHDFDEFPSWMIFPLYMHFVYHCFWWLIFWSKYGLFCICILYINQWYAFCISFVMQNLIWFWDSNFMIMSKDWNQLNVLEWWFSNSWKMKIWPLFFRMLMSLNGCQQWYDLNEKMIH